MKGIAINNKSKSINTVKDKIYDAFSAEVFCDHEIELSGQV